MIRSAAYMCRMLKRGSLYVHAWQDHGHLLEIFSLFINRGALASSLNDYAPSEAYAG